RRDGDVQRRRPARGEGFVRAADRRSHGRGRPAPARADAAPRLAGGRLHRADQGRAAVRVRNERGGGAMTAVRAEWTKLRSVRSTTWMLLALGGLTIALGALSCSTSHTEGGSPGNGGDDDIVMFSLVGVYLVQVAAVAFGVLAICGEYASGTIRATFAANPH